ncbi:AAA family ATPase [Burkholderia sp. BCC0405]|uniref:AAA family ATPase n=1 Tax=Burkholderia sp. BCC0405 TaxID=2676298 RepID=UPI00158D456F|nr:AAA family ATPase [Burkholderia sp. BCC0405]
MRDFGQAPGAEDDATRRFFVVTGGPGSGKSTLLDALEHAGFSRSQEAGRGVIRDQMAIDGQALPWRDPAAFAELMLSWEMRSYDLARRARGPVFFDRGVPDVVGYLRLAGLPVPAHAQAAARRFRYHPRVFIAPPWPDIYMQDTERRQDFAEAVRTYDAMVECYTTYGYRLIELPRDSVQARVRFVTDALGAE